MLRLDLQKMKVPGLNSQGPLLILRITDVLCEVDAQITITRYPVSLRPEQILPNQGTNWLQNPWLRVTNLQPPLVRQKRSHGNWAEEEQGKEDKRENTANTANELNREILTQSQVKHKPCVNHTDEIHKYGDTLG